MVDAQASVDEEIDILAPTGDSELEAAGFFSLCCLFHFHLLIPLLE